ncbi:ankyrin repeat-containing domain protein [Boletus edulis]|nr:ankyrin repeat-containing domain protein [Boletus edulis]
MFFKLHTRVMLTLSPVLHMALRCFNRDKDVLEVVKFLVGHGCCPLEANSRGETPLHIAARRSEDSIAGYLIAQGASVSTKASNGDTVLHFVTSDVYSRIDDFKDYDLRALEMVKFFVGYGSDPAASNDDGETPFHNVVDRWYIKTIKHLLSLNFLVPHDILFTAIQSGDNNSVDCRLIIETLIASGCDTQMPNSEGDAPLQVAIKMGKVETVKYLLSVASVHKSPLEDLLSSVALAPESVQDGMRRTILDCHTWLESPQADLLLLRSRSDVRES